MWEDIFLTVFGVVLGLVFPWVYAKRKNYVIVYRRFELTDLDKIKRNALLFYGSNVIGVVLISAWLASFLVISEALFMSRFFVSAIGFCFLSQAVLCYKYIEDHLPGEESEKLPKVKDLREISVENEKEQGKNNHVKTRVTIRKEVVQNPNLVCLA